LLPPSRGKLPSGGPSLHTDPEMGARTIKTVGLREGDGAWLFRWTGARRPAAARSRPGRRGDRGTARRALRRHQARALLLAVLSVDQSWRVQSAARAGVAAGSGAGILGRRIRRGGGGDRLPQAGA